MSATPSIPAFPCIQFKETSLERTQSSPLRHWTPFAQLSALVDESMLRTVGRRAILDAATDLVSRGVDTATEDFAEAELKFIAGWRQARRRAR
jgi:hypothetical protein